MTFSCARFFIVLVAFIGITLAVAVKGDLVAPLSTELSAAAPETVHEPPYIRADVDGSIAVKGTDLSLKSEPNQALGDIIVPRGDGNPASERHYTRDLQTFTGAVVKLELIDADKNIKIMDLANGTVVQTANPSFNIRAVLKGTGTGSVLFGYNAVQRYRVENIKPFTFCGDFRTRYRKCDKLGFGTHTITATPFSRQGARGKCGSRLSLTFQVVACPSVESFINSITLSGRILTLSGTTPEDLALQWLVNDDPLKLMPCTEADKFRLRQRFALLTLGWQTTKLGQVVALANNWFRTDDECQWYFNSDYLSTECDDARRIVQYRIIGATIPADFGLLRSLTNFYAYGGSPGTLPSSIGRWSNLTSFEVSSNDWGGTLPATIGKWTNLQSLFIENNALTGSLPPSIANWTHLEYFSAKSNSLTGTLPSSISLWTKLFNFWIDGNQFTGSLPPTIGSWSDVSQFRASSNKFTGVLPSTLGAWSTIRNFEVSNNRFRGTIPEYVTNWTNVVYVALDRNNFVGTVPPLAFCPITISPITLSDIYLSADCGKGEIRCDCCSACFEDGKGSGL